MKICYLADGGSVHTLRWCMHFRDLGHEIHLITLKNTHIEGIHIHYIDAGTINSTGGNWKIIFKYRKVKAIIKKIKPDILHSHYATSYGFLGALSGFHPFVVTALGTDVLISPFQSVLYKILIKFTLKKADWITSMAEHMTEKIISLGIKKDKISVVIFGIDEKIFNNTNRIISTDKFILTSTRNFEPIYNIQLLLNAIKLLDDKIPNLQVNLIGDGSLRNELEKLVSEYNISDKVNFMGKVKQSIISDELKHSHLFVTVSLSDGNNISLNEAMACGTFSIASNIPANKQWISEGLNGFLVPTDKPEILADKILFVFNNYSKLEKPCIEYNNNIIQEKALWNNNMKQVFEKYEFLINHYGK